jgi:hypothetical protein
VAVAAIMARAGFDIEFLTINTKVKPIARYSVIPKEV